MNRRRLIASTFAAVAGSGLAKQALADVPERTLAVHNLHTGESLKATYWEGGRYLDDALSAVDTHTEAEILRSLRDALSGRTALIASHRVSAIRDATWIIVLDEGRVVEQGRHADLLASDLDEETALRYVDRFLMYYVKTADRLMRTSTWMDQLEGGIDHLRDVVVNDTAGNTFILW